MSALFIVVPIALVVSALAVLAFVWAARSGQFEDLETPAFRALLGDAERSDVPDDPSTPSESDPEHS